jgi:hypothetical protein
VHDRRREADYDPSDAELSPGWEAEIQRRLRKIEAGEAAFVSGDEVFAKAEAILRGER